MTLSSIGRKSAPLLFCAVLATGCAHRRPAPEAAKPTLTPANTTPPERQHYIIELLGAGKRDQARVEVQQLLKEQPDNKEAATFLSEIDTDPQTLLGAQSTPHVIQPGETLTTLADQDLGDSNLFYALARYNNIDVPDSAAAGQSILIPSKPKPAEHSDHPERHERPVHSEHSEHKEAPPALRKREETPAEKAPAAPAAESPSAHPAPAPAAHTPPAHDPARANALRSQALVEMDKGAIDHAVSLLREASALNPDSQPISADLARALRIQGGAHK